jgi:ABC-type sugar transport system ATPase subunit
VNDILVAGVEDSQPVLTLEGVHKSFAGVRALRGVSFDLRAGEVHALIGENGAGKSTLTKVITGALQADSGTMKAFGRVVADNSPTISRGLRIAAIYQQPSLFPDLTVAENIALALEGGQGMRRVDWKARFAQARMLLGRIGSTIDPQRLARTLSMAEQQVVEIAKAIGADARILLMDEPTAVLTEAEVVSLFTLIGSLRSDGVAMIYISHRLEEILSIADRITVLRDGEKVACRAAAEVDRAELIQLMVGRSLASVFPKRSVRMGDVAIEVRDLENPAVGLHSISFHVRRGEIFGLAGLVGSGRTELAQTLFGLTPCASVVELDGKVTHIDSAGRAIRHGVGYLPEDRRQHGVILEMSVAANISLAALGPVSRWGMIDPGREDRLASRAVDELRIKTPSIRVAVETLSGGNQQKVALARWLATRPRVMVLDEPTQGVDVGSKAEIHELIVQCAERGMAIVLISSELPELLGMSDRIGVMRAGTIVGVLDRNEATQVEIMSLAFGHAVNQKGGAPSAC